MNDDNLSDTHIPGHVLPFKPRIVTPEVTVDQSKANPDIVLMFERCLKAAKEGKIKFGAVAVVDHRDVAITSWEPSDAPSSVVTSALGAISFLNSRFGSSADDGGEFTDELIDD
jgi:hypothetical protein